MKFIKCGKENIDISGGFTSDSKTRDRSSHVQVETVRGQSPEGYSG